MTRRTLHVVLEFNPADLRVVVRGVWPGDMAPLPALAPNCVQSYVAVYEATDMHAHVAFEGLTLAQPGMSAQDLAAAFVRGEIDMGGLWHVIGNTLYLGPPRPAGQQQAPYVVLPGGMDDAYKIAQAHNGELVAQQLGKVAAGGLESMTVGELLQRYPNGFAIGPGPDPALMKTVYASSRLANVAHNHPLPPVAGGYQVVEVIELWDAAPQDVSGASAIGGAWAISDGTVVCALCGQPIPAHANYFESRPEVGDVAAYHLGCFIDSGPPRKNGQTDH